MKDEVKCIDVFTTRSMANAVKNTFARSWVEHKGPEDFRLMVYAKEYPELRDCTPVAPDDKPPEQLDWLLLDASKNKE